MQVEGKEQSIHLLLIDLNKTVLPVYFALFVHHHLSQLAPLDKLLEKQQLEVWTLFFPFTLTLLLPCNVLEWS